MNHFEARAGALFCEEVGLEAIAEAVQTPVYVYSTATLERHYRVFNEALAGQPALGSARIAYAIKANANLSVVRTLARLGAGADTVSEGEIRRALAADVPAQRIIFSGVGKSRAELSFALTAGVGQINVESEDELDLISVLARTLGVRPTLALRVNPGVGAGGHAKITTGEESSKFGVTLTMAPHLYARARSDPSIAMVGLACHIGSQITDLGPMAEAFGAMRDLVLDLRARGHGVERLDLGGGLGAPYFDRPDPPSPADFAVMAAEAAGGLDLDYTFEPGRAIAANAGVLLTRAIRVNQRDDGRRFLVLDAAMNDLLRPAMYDAWHEIRPVRPRAGALTAYDVVGPVCESGDTFAQDRRLPPVETGDLLVLLSAGAYGAVMASEYNSRLLAPEVLVRGAEFAVVRPRPTYDDMLARERVAPWL